MSWRAAALALVAAGCAPSLPAPLVRVESASPSGAVPPDAVEVAIAFTGAIDAAGLVAGPLLVLCRREDLRAVAAAAEAAEGAPPDLPVVPARLEVEEGGRRAVLRPLAPLPAEAPFAAVLSPRLRDAGGRPVLDPEGKSRAFAVLFETGPAVDRTPPAARWLEPPHGPVPRDLAALRIAFDEPVAGALALPAGGGEPVAPAPDVLGLDLAAPLAAGALAVDLGQVRDAAGNAPLPLEPLEVSRCASAGAPACGGAELSAAELGVEVSATLAGMGRLVAEVSALPGEPACGSAPAAPAVARVLGGVAACPGWDPCQPAARACPAALALRGLCPGRALRVRLAGEDLAGHRGAFGAWLPAAARPPRPAPVLSEVLADADAPEAGGEYVEVVNVGTGDADLSGLVLAKRTASGTVARCTLGAAEGGPVPPGGYALVVGGAYDGRYALPPGTAVHRCGATALAGGLANDRAPALALEDGAGAVVSSAGWVAPALRCPSGALERVRPDAPDEPASWACGARTPGACNAATPPEACAKRPW
ncbi:lamin tail domain-containing protein [Anaeromyxobacter diazotrophicus]|uniref:LTD domain-containing protein n=1 Tax=Anaeromyxobacter diazotrophicus TaxID=2590199 RepID=A0A7I9VH13_9BACT|nr:lamin tail domain-containing protein [Anaeromyxobacter diazotrophicus]GEJ55681.1 hypothetical protein AMYX_04220 [Anaeromyxobacter diazotrophicus]